jgi:hypothetical protein
VCKLTLIDNLLPFLQQNFSLRTLSRFTPSFPPQLAQFRSEYVEPYIIQPLSSLLASSTPDLVNVVLLLLILYISLRILDYARRMIMFWLFFVLRLAFWGSIIGGGLYVYNVGPTRALRDLGWIWGILQATVEDLSVNPNSRAYRSYSGATGRKYGYTAGRQWGRTRR